MPCSPMRVVEPPRQVADEAGLGDSSASSISSSVASARPSVRFSRADIENRVGSSNAVATSERSSFRE